MCESVRRAVYSHNNEQTFWEPDRPWNYITWEFSDEEESRMRLWWNICSWDSQWEFLKYKEEEYIHLSQQSADRDQRLLKPACFWFSNLSLRNQLFNQEVALLCLDVCLLRCFLICVFWSCSFWAVRNSLHSDQQLIIYLNTTTFLQEIKMFYCLV